MAEESKNAANHQTKHIDDLESSLADVLAVQAAAFAAVPLSALALESRDIAALKGAGYATLENLLNASRSELLSLPRMGILGANRVEQAVRSYLGLEDLTSTLPEAPPAPPLHGRIKDGIARDPETGFVLVPDRRSLEFDRTLSNLFDADEQDFAEVPIEELDLRVRSFNCLTSVGCETVEDLLDKTTRELAGIRSMGENSLKDIFQKTQAYIAAAPSGRLFVKQIDLDENPAFRAALESVLEGREVDTARLREEMSSLFSDYETAVEAVGEETCLALYMDPQYGTRIAEILTEFGIMWSHWTQSLKESRALLAKIPEDVRTKRAIPFMAAYEAQNEPLGPVHDECTSDMLVSQLCDIGEALKRKGEDPRVARKLNAFLEWLNFDIADQFESAFAQACASRQDSGERTRDMISMRVQNVTLEAIGQKYGITRERVRQIENNVRVKLWHTRQMADHDFVLGSYAMLGGKILLHEKDLTDLMGPLAGFIWNCVKTDYKVTERPYSYEPALDVIFVMLGPLDGWSANQIHLRIERMQSSLPNTVAATDKDSVVRAAAQKTGLPMRVVSEIFANAYSATGSLFYMHKERLERSDMVAYVLREFFPDGCSVPKDLHTFRTYLQEAFGQDAGNVSDRSLTTAIEEAGVLCAKDTYMDPDRLPVDADAIRAVNDYLEASPREIISCAEILDALADALRKGGVTSSYLLRGGLKKYGYEYRTTRRFVRKTPSSTLADEVEAFVEEKGDVSRAQVADAFPALSASWLMQIIHRRTNILNVDEEHCIHATQLDLEPEDYEQLRVYLANQTAHGAVHIAAVDRDLRKEDAPLLARNGVNSKNMLFAILQYMFGEEFSFSRPYIAKAGQIAITHKSAVLEHLDHVQDASGIELDDLVDILNEYGIRYVSVGMVCRMLAPEYVRMDKNILMRSETAGITDEVRERTVEAVQAKVAQQGYLVSAKGPEQISLPDFGGEWTDFLLDSVVASDRTVYPIRAPRNPVDHSNLIYVSEEFKTDTFDSFVRKLLDKKKAQGPITKEEAATWLRQEGIAGKQLPHIFEDETYWNAP